MVTHDETVRPWFLSTCHCRLRLIPSSSLSATEGTLWSGTFDNANWISTVWPISAGDVGLWDSLTHLCFAVQRSGPVLVRQ